jgi:chondroitin 4-sulfotransferase 11
MLISEKYKYLFVHIQKTAGTSITKCLHQIGHTKNISNTHSFLNSQPIHEYDNYFKFCFVRNPFDRLVSWYNMILKKDFTNDFSRYILNNSSNFSEFLDLTEIINETNEQEKITDSKYLKSISFNQLDYITDDEGNIMVDYIGRYENLNNDFHYVMSKLGREKYNLPHINKYNHENYRKYYTERDIEKVVKMYSKDLDYFEYYF